jgi:hypothetical protein
MRPDAGWPPVTAGAFDGQCAVLLVMLPQAIKSRVAENCSPLAADVPTRINLWFHCHKLAQHLSAAEGNSTPCDGLKMDASTGRGRQ